ncbi:MAG: hypothetical protein IPP77_13875 [Bacteroidetes bacterium]|nr:hypothetical protein [Bacteroidota bacterium]
MHEIEPYHYWRDYYISAEDKLSPFYNRRYSEMEFSNQIYNYLIHPQWDFFGSSTLYCKILFADYEQGFAVIELIGEWNDAVHNDIMEMKRGLIDPLIENGIVRFVIIAENVLNFHHSDELYYEEWYDDIKDDGGWVVIFNLRKHLLVEMQKIRLHHYININENYSDILWRKFKPMDLLDLAENLLLKRLI